MKHPFILSVCAVSLLALGACSNAKEALGLSSPPPDEFLVVDHPPLSMPPDYALRPPRPGEEIERGNNPSVKAAKALYGDGTMKLVPQQGVSSLGAQNLSGSEKALIAQSGSDKASPVIRSQLANDPGDAPSRRLIDQLLFWKKPKDPGTVVDPAAEAQRLQAVKQANQPVTSGATTAYDRGKETSVQ